MRIKLTGWALVLIALWILAVSGLLVAWRRHGAVRVTEAEA